MALQSFELIGLVPFSPHPSSRNPRGTGMCRKCATRTDEGQAAPCERNPQGEGSQLKGNVVSSPRSNPEQNEKKEKT